MVALVYAKYLYEYLRSTVVPKSQVIAHSVKDPTDFTIVGISADIKRVREDSVWEFQVLFFRTRKACRKGPQWMSPNRRRPGLNWRKRLKTLSVCEINCTTKT